MHLVLRLRGGVSRLSRPSIVHSHRLGLADSVALGVKTRNHTRLQMRMNEEHYRPETQRSFKRMPPSKPIAALFSTSKATEAINQHIFRSHTLESPGVPT